MNVNMRLLKAVDFVVVAVVDIVVFVVVVNVVVVNFIVAALFVVTDNIYIFLCLINVDLRLLKATVEFLWWLVGGVCKVIFVSNPTSVLRLCCVVVGIVTTDKSSEGSCQVVEWFLNT